MRYYEIYIWSSFEKIQRKGETITLSRYSEPVRNTKFEIIVHTLIQFLHGNFFSFLSFFKFG